MIVARNIVRAKAKARADRCQASEGEEF